jgi:hypothetical protein
MKTLNWNKIDSPFPVHEIDKGQISRIPLDQAYGNAAAVVAPKLPTRPIPTEANFPKDN